MPLPQAIARKLPKCGGPNPAIYGPGPYGSQDMPNCPACGEAWDWHDATDELIDQAAEAIVKIAVPKPLGPPPPRTRPLARRRWHRQLKHDIATLEAACRLNGINPDEIR